MAFQVFGFLGLGLCHQRAKLVHAFLAGKRLDRLAGGQQALGLAHGDGFPGDRHPFLGALRERGDPLLLARVACGQQAQALQLGREQAHGSVVRLQVLRLPGDDETALPGLCILQAGKEFIELRHDRAGMRFALPRFGCRLHASIGQPADTDQAGQHQHQQAIHQPAPDCIGRHAGRGAVMHLLRRSVGCQFSRGHGRAQSRPMATCPGCGSALEAGCSQK